MAELEQVEVRHPDIDGTTLVPKSAYADHWARAGWVLADPPDDRARAAEVLIQAGFEPSTVRRLLAVDDPPGQSPPTPEQSDDQAPETESPGPSDAQTKPPKSRRASTKEES